jgi:hypothetical protein
MSKIKSFDRATCRLLGKKVEEALAPLAEELGISFDYKGGRFSSNAVTMKIEAATLSADGSVNSKEAEAFKQLAKMYGFEDKDLNAEFTVGGDKYAIKGLNTRAHKMPIQADRVRDGRGFKFPADAVLRALGRKTKSSIPDFSM